MANTTAIKRKVSEEIRRQFVTEGDSGNTFYVDSGGLVVGASLPSQSSSVYTTLQAAVTAAAAGDTIIVNSGHTETISAVVTISKRLRIVGTGWGRARPAITGNAAANDIISVTAANVSIENMRLIGAASATTACLNIAAADFTGKKISFEHGAAPLLAVTVASGGDRFVLEDCNWLGTAAGPDNCVKIEASVSGWRISRAYANYSASAGLDLGFLASSFVMQDYVIERVICVGFDSVAIDINSSSAAVGDGICTDCRFVASTAITSIEDCIDAGGCAFIECYATDAVAGRGVPVPIVSAS